MNYKFVYKFLRTGIVQHYEIKERSVSIQSYLVKRVEKCCPSLCVSVVAVEGPGKPESDSLFTNITFRIYVLYVYTAVELFCLKR
jgi:hypothetical protein